MQCMIFYVRAWPGPSKSVETKCGGKGFQTTARRAMMWHHEHLLRPEHARRVTNATLRLVGRAMQDKDPVAIARSTAPEDLPSSSSQDAAVSSGPALEPTVFQITNALLEDLVDATKAGWLPWPANFSFEDCNTNYAGEVWQVTSQSKVQPVSLLILEEWTST